ncbi:MAG: O-acetyl-ADP-ribose deacetylase [Lachnospiraceae bacterium]|nr:O-acetyl-ADP-ribose deacetylase [Lachnospiraceae bacterium]
MPLQFVRQDITKMQVDAIVNAANSTLLGGGGVDGCIHRAAGPELLEACRSLGGCPTGSARITKGYQLPATYVIHAVGPVWQGGAFGEREQLISCYRTALELAADYHCESVAFPLISSGIYGYPKAEALRVAVDTISDFLMTHDMLVYITIFDKKAYEISSQLYASIEAYIDDRYVECVEEYEDPAGRRLSRLASLFGKIGSRRPKESPQLPLETPEPVSRGASRPTPLESSLPTPLGSIPKAPIGASRPKKPQSPWFHKSLDEALNSIDESFSEMLLRKIDERGMTDAACYKKANISRKLFSKIRSDKLYKPSKPTALAFAVALELSMAETTEMLMKAGFALSHSNKFDIIIEFFISQGRYNIYEINEALFAFDQNLLGGG